jgi:hypothetical protein
MTLMGIFVWSGMFTQPRRRGPEPFFNQHYSIILIWGLNALYFLPGHAITARSPSRSYPRPTFDSHAAAPRGDEAKDGLSRERALPGCWRRCAYPCRPNPALAVHRSLSKDVLIELQETHRTLEPPGAEERSEKEGTMGDGLL